MSAPSVPCPTCKRAVPWGPESTFRPFCSERCRLIDLGAWFSGERAIPADQAPDHEPWADSDDDRSR